VEPIAVVFGTALVAAMATDTWQQACKAAAALWRRVRPRHRGIIEGELEELREQVLVARRDGRADIEQAIAGKWQGRCQDLVQDDPGAAVEMQQVLGQILVPMLAPADSARVGRVIMTGISHGSGTFNQVAGDQYNVWP
jgi:hypothetical protein